MSTEIDPASVMRFVLLLRQAGITDPRVLGAFEKTPRSAFFPKSMQSLALEDREMPIGAGHVSMRPSQLAMVVRALDVRAQDRVLEVGSGSGYATGVVATLGRQVVGLERRQAMVSQARAALGALRVMNAHVYHADGLGGWPDDAPFDRILLHAGAPPFVPRLIADLVEGGLMAAPTGLAGGQAWRVFQKAEGCLVERQTLMAYSGPTLESGLVGEG